MMKLRSRLPLLRRARCAWFVTSDACGLVCASLAVGLIVYAQCVTVGLVVWPADGVASLHSLLYTTCAIITLTSHCRAQFSDPGSVQGRFLPQKLQQDVPIAQAATATNRQAYPIAKPLVAPTICHKCLTVKPKGTHHCSICARCISRMDHHCPWVNNCVAAYNQKFFLQFLTWTGVMSGYSAFLIARHLYRCAQDVTQCTDITPVQIILIIMNLFESIVFGLFVAVMFYDQLSAIFENTPYIDSLQGKRGDARVGKVVLLNEVFGEPFSWRWIIPVSLPAKVFQEFEDQCEQYCHGVFDEFEGQNSSDDDGEAFH